MLDKEKDCIEPFAVDEVVSASIKDNETGKVLKKSKKRIKEKVKLLKRYDDWFFAVTDKNLTVKYKQFGKTFDKRSLKTALMGYVEKCP